LYCLPLTKGQVRYNIYIEQSVQSIGNFCKIKESRKSGSPATVTISTTDEE